MRPLIGITEGDPNGIGPEIICKALQRPAIKDSAFYLIIGTDRLFKTLKKRKNVAIVSPPKPFRDSSYACLKLGARLCLENKISALVTAPIDKAKISQKEGILFLGHTGFLKTACEKFYKKSFSPTMLFTAQKKYLSLATVHIPLSHVSKHLTPSLLQQTVLNTHRALTYDFKIKNPRLALLGLNPHAGERGLLGNEEAKILLPLTDWALKRKIDLSGPFSPDSFFATKWHEFHGTIALYHDQGLIPFKLKYFHEAVNVTTGLPIIRTSVDHGVGYDIAGKGVANALSMVHAIKVATLIVRNRKDAL